MTHPYYCTYLAIIIMTPNLIDTEDMMKKLWVLTLVASLFLVIQGCGSSSKQQTTTAPTTPTVPTTPTTPEAVHLIKPEQVAEYVEKFKKDQAQLEFQLQGEVYKIGLVDFDMDENIILAKYSMGYVYIGFDLQNETPIKSLQVLESNVAFEGELTDPKRLLETKDIEIEQDGDNIIYSGTVTETASGDVLNVRLVFNESLINGGASNIVIDGNKAFINGDLGTNTYIQITDLTNNHPAVDTLVLQSISGSVNDAINMHTGRLVRNAQYTTMVEATSAIYSGGVDLYAAGAKRVYTDGAKVGVHSWCCVDGVTADKLGRDHKAHGAQLTYFREMLGSELGPEFYFFTIEAAPFDGAHEMTKAELEKYLLQ